MHLRLLAMSDTHLGEDGSLLSYPHGRQHLWKELRRIFGKDDVLQVDELILVGDIPDRTLSSTSEIITHTNALVQTLGSAAKVRKAIYVMGNHDHTIWTQYRNRQAKANVPVTDPHVTVPGGELVVSAGVAQNTVVVEGLLTLFFGYPDGSSWRNVGDMSFLIANPIYATRPEGLSRTYAFTHGVHFSQAVLLSQRLKQLAASSQLDHWLGGIEIDPGQDPKKATSLPDLEKRTAPFIDSLWCDPRNNPTPQTDQTWHLYTRISGRLDHCRPDPGAPRLYHAQEDLGGALELKDDDGNVPQSVPQLTDPQGAPLDSALRSCEAYFLRNMVDYLQASEIPPDPLTFVYGDTHTGGWGKLRPPSGSGMSPIHVYNCGGWVTTRPDNHPACQLFAVDAEGKEYVLDLSYKDVKVDGESLLALAASESEHRLPISSRILDGLLRVLWPRQP